MKWLVCGGRYFGKLVKYDTDIFVSLELIDQRRKEYLFILSTLDRLSVEKSTLYDPDDNWLPSDIEIISGMASGADTAAIDWAVCNWCKTHEYPANWNLYGKSAGYIRNKQMLDEGKPDLVIAFPGGKGTKMMVDIARKAGVQVMEINYDIR